MRTVVRDHVPVVAAVLTLASLGLIFGAVLGRLPSELVPRASTAFLAAVPHVNAGISVVAIVTSARGCSPPS